MHAISLWRCNLQDQNAQPRVNIHNLFFPGETQWEAPEGLEDAAPSADGASAADGGGWTAHADESSGATYYYNAGTGETTWEMPADMQQADGASQSTSSTVSAFGLCCSGREQPRQLNSNISK